MTIKKARIQSGFPKLAFYRRSDNRHDITKYNIYFPIKSGNFQPSTQYKVSDGELLVLIAGNHSYYHYIPYNLLADEKVPLNAALTWTASYRNFPDVHDSAIEIL